ncbi:MAG: amino acid permease [Promethearchaeota archaeon]|nr:MAG: amino acid permease [Candidatus Lokiarchaeota archaeon]
MNEKEPKPKKKYGITAGILYGVGCGIGGSIFVLLGIGIQVAGPGVLISLILGGILIFLTALNYSELSTSLPISGGAYNFSKEGIGGFSAFIIGTFLWIANIATCSFSAQVFTIIIIIFFPFLEPFALPVAILAVVLTSIVFFRTQRFAIRTLIILTITLIAIFFIFIISGIFISPITNSSGYNPDYLYSSINFLGIIQMFALLFIFFTSITQNLAYFNVDLKNPSKNIPKVNILAILFTLFIYLSITSVVLINLGNQSETTSNSPVLLGEILFDILGPVGFYLMGFAMLISTLIAMNAALGSATNLLQALARDNYVPNKLTKLNKKKTVPTYALMFTTIIAIIITFLAVIYGSIGFTAEITTLIYFIGLAAVNFAAVNLRRKRKSLARPFKAPFFPYLPIFVGTTCLILAFVLEPTAIILGSILFLIAILYYSLTITDRYSIIITMAGLKVLCVIVIGSLIWILNNAGIIHSNVQGFEFFFTYVLLRILIAICIFTIFTIILDIVPLREIVYFMIKKIDKERVAIDIGVGQIIELDKMESKLIYNANKFIGIIQIVCSIFIYYLIMLFELNLISIEQINFMGIKTNQATSEFIYIASLIFFGFLLTISGSYMLYLNRRFKLI